MFIQKFLTSEWTYFYQFVAALLEGLKANTHGNDFTTIMESIKTYMLGKTTSFFSPVDDTSQYMKCQLFWQSVFERAAHMPKYIIL